jgi:hypothetical protein
MTQGRYIWQMMGTADGARRVKIFVSSPLD